MAKRRTSAKKTASKSSRKKAVKKSATRKRAAKTTRKTTRKAPRTSRPSADVLDLKALRGTIERAVAVLAGRGGGAEASSRLASAQAVMSGWVSDIDSICAPEEEEICGPTMLIPLA